MNTPVRVEGRRDYDPPVAWETLACYDCGKRQHPKRSNGVYALDAVECLALDIPVGHNLAICDDCRETRQERIGDREVDPAEAVLAEVKAAEAWLDEKEALKEVTAQINAEANQFGNF
jgi:NMD protein affecting ribosome stability and mRNA decay